MTDLPPSSIPPLGPANVPTSTEPTSSVSDGSAPEGVGAATDAEQAAVAAAAEAAVKKSREEAAAAAREAAAAAAREAAERHAAASHAANIAASAAQVVTPVADAPSLEETLAAFRGLAGPVQELLCVALFMAFAQQTSEPECVRP